MQSLNILFLTLFVSANCDSNNIIVPCNKDDDVCITRSANLALPKVLNGIPSLGVESSDPLHVDLIVGDLSTLKYTFTDNTLTGFTNCHIHHLKYSFEKSKITFNMTCPNCVLEGKYQISGRLIILPIEGEGPYRIHTKQFEFGIEAETKEAQGKDGKTYLTIKKYKVEAEPQGKMTFDFRNLFNGQKDLADAVLHFANENWKEVADFVQRPAIAANVKKAIANTNKFLKSVPVDELFL